MSRNTVIAVVMVIVLVIFGWYLLRPKGTTTPEVSEPTPTSTASKSASPQASSSAAMTEKVVTISSTGFSPKSITIKAGESVTWTNSDSANHTVNSSPHPAHTDYPLLNLGVIKNGESKSLSFPKAGTFKYHDHLNPSLFGSVTVE